MKKPCEFQDHRITYLNKATKITILLLLVLNYRQFFPFTVISLIPIDYHLTQKLKLKLTAHLI